MKMIYNKGNVGKLHAIAALFINLPACFILENMFSLHFWL